MRRPKITPMLQLMLDRACKLVCSLYPGLSALDLVGPHPFFAELSNSQVHLLWKDLNPVACSLGYSIVPTTSIKDCPRDLDVLFVPGGTSGTIAMMNDDEILSFLADRGSRARYVTSVCTGSLVLGVAGLWNGYDATCHWRFRDLLALVGARPIEERVVIDRNSHNGWWCDRQNRFWAGARIAPSRSSGG